MKTLILCLFIFSACQNSPGTKMPADERRESWARVDSAKEVSKKIYEYMELVYRNKMSDKEFFLKTDPLTAQLDTLKTRLNLEERKELDAYGERWITFMVERKYSK